VEQRDLTKSTIAAFGAEGIDLSEMSGHPNSVFTRDTALSTPERFVRLRLGLPTREGEDLWVADAGCGCELRSWSGSGFVDLNRSTLAGTRYDSRERRERRQCRFELEQPKRRT
jgi:hypothetical protein